MIFQSWKTLVVRVTLYSIHFLALMTLKSREVEGHFKILLIEHRQLKPGKTMLVFGVVCKESEWVINFPILFDDY
jgi:hypothetical protein